MWMLLGFVSVIRPIYGLALLSVWIRTDKFSTATLLSI